MERMRGNAGERGTLIGAVEEVVVGKWMLRWDGSEMGRRWHSPESQSVYHQVSSLPEPSSRTVSTLVLCVRIPFQPLWVSANSGTSNVRHVIHTWDIDAIPHGAS